MILLRFIQPISGQSLPGKLCTRISLENPHEKRQKERRKLVHEKHTNATRINHQTARTRRIVLRDETKIKSKDPLKDWTIETTKDHPFGKEGIVEYINRKREMFLVKELIMISDYYFNDYFIICSISY